MSKKYISVWIVLFLSIAVVGCGRDKEDLSSSERMQNKTDGSVTPLVNVPNSNQTQITKASYLTKERTPDGKIVAVTKYPASIAVVVNKNIYLPKGYAPKDLIFPQVSFLFKEYVAKRMMRREAALQLEKMFAAAKKDGIYLSGASGYRSYATQAAVFNNYVKRDGYEKARTYSAIPGTSEHQPVWQLM